MSGTRISPPEVKLCEHGHVPVLEECLGCDYDRSVACLIELGCREGRDGKWERLVCPRCERQFPPGCEPYCGGCAADAVWRPVLS